MTLRIEALRHTYRAETRTTVCIDHWLVQGGQQILLRGVSGSVKTTLFNILVGVLKPSSGTVYYDQQSLYALPEAMRDRFRARYIGCVFSESQSDWDAHGA